MSLEILDIKFKDLPKDLVIEMPSDATELDVERMIESLKAQLIYNSSFDENEKERSLQINILNRSGNTFKLHVEPK
jgi:hypothetical protein